MTVPRFEGCEAGFDANIGRRLVDAEAEARYFDGRIGEREEVCDGKLGGRHVGFGVVVFFSCCSAFVGGLEFSGQWLVVRMDVSAGVSQYTIWLELCGSEIQLTFGEDEPYDKW